MPEPEARGRGLTAVRPYQIRGRFLTAIALRLEGPADRAALSALDVQLRQTPQFFADAPLVIDLEQAAGQVSPQDLLALIEHLRFRRVSVFAVQGGTGEQAAAAATLGLISIPPGRDAGPRAVETPVAVAPAPAESPAAPAAPAARTANVLITTPVRSGQTIMAEAGDLTVVGTVASGSELIAAGSIHVYGPLRGRASAGVFGDETARIFCHSLDAELLSIAGLYQTSESIDPAVRRLSVQVLLRGDVLCVEPFGPPSTRDRSNP